MSDIGDQFTAVLTREFVAASSDYGMRVVAMTTTASLVAALAARRLGAEDLAVATGFGTLDASPHPTLSLGEMGLRSAASPRGPITDIFVAVARGLVGVVVIPAQLDAAAATNLSYVGGTRDAPKVALPGSRGLPDNNDSPARVWYLVPDHSPRTLVDRVDFASGPSPSAGRVRRLVTKLGVFAFEPPTGWTTEGLFPGVRPHDVTSAEGFPISVPDDVPEIDPPTSKELAAFEAEDPQDLRSVEFDGRSGASHARNVVAQERADAASD